MKIEIIMTVLFRMLMIFLIVFKTLKKNIVYHSDTALHEGCSKYQIKKN